MPFMLVLLTAVRATLVVITAGIVDAGKKSSVRISVVSDRPDVAAGLFHGVFAGNLFPCERKTPSLQSVTGEGRTLPPRERTLMASKLDARVRHRYYGNACAPAAYYVTLNMIAAAIFN